MERSELVAKLEESTANGNWEDAVRILETIVDGEEDSSATARYYYTAGVIYRDELDDPNKAVEHFEHALDADPANMLMSFEAIHRILSDRQRWMDLERSHRRMIARLQQLEDPSLVNIQASLWTNLGNIHKDHLGDEETAREAFRIGELLNQG